LGKPRSFTFSFIVKRCSWVKLIRSWFRRDRRLVELFRSHEFVWR
jgi:hypothetical protein